VLTNLVVNNEQYARFDKNQKGKGKSSPSPTEPSPPSTSKSSSKKKKNTTSNGSPTSITTNATAGATVPKQEKSDELQFAQLNTANMPPHNQSVNQSDLLSLAAFNPSNIETPKALFSSDMPFTPLTPGTSAIIDNIMNNARNAPQNLPQPPNAQTLLNNVHPGQQPPTMNMFNGQQPNFQANLPQFAADLFKNQQFLQQQTQLQVQAMQALQQQQQMQLSQANKRKSSDAGSVREDDSPSTKRRKSGVNLSIKVPDGTQIPLRRVDEDHSHQANIPNPSQSLNGDNNAFQAPPPKFNTIPATIDKSKQAGNSSESIGAVFSPTTNEKSPTIQLSTPTSLGSLDWPSPNSAFKKDAISS
jgi:hypothetical protein